MSRRALQAGTGLIGLATVVLATMQILFGVHSPVYASAQLPDLAVLDSNLRFFGGLGLGLGLILLWIVPTIERRTALFRAVWLCTLLGGLGRLLSLALVGAPPVPMVVFTVLEVAGTPVFIYRQHRVAVAAAAGVTPE